ncbi:MAG: imidazole glycerol phosphate synthase subunit HisF [Bdellovibrionaceae bacterium]|nr:imidazole glycerol phosphate synthase subunit HisF [Pseudobdellovibrionaceae bacterium]
MLSKRIIACLDVKDGQVVKGQRFRNHEILGDALEMAQKYSDAGIDELVFYDITASSEKRVVDAEWIRKLGRVLNIPFCVAGGIRSVSDAYKILNAGADKISINSPALERPELITELAKEFGVQCVVVGVDSRSSASGDWVYLYTGDEAKTLRAQKNTSQWLQEVQERGAGEVVLNCMDSDGVGDGYDLVQLAKARAVLKIPLVASGGAKTVAHFEAVFKEAQVDAALAAGVFHRNELTIQNLKIQLKNSGIEIRI